MQWQHERRLIFAVGPAWSGYFCERCCWNRPLPADAGERDALARGIGEEFNAHNCKQFAHENWKEAAGSAP